MLWVPGAHRAYDMAAIQLKGVQKATTNFNKERYQDEPFMMVRSPASWAAHRPCLQHECCRAHVPAVDNPHDGMKSSAPLDLRLLHIC